MRIFTAIGLTGDARDGRVPAYVATAAMALLMITYCCATILDAYGQNDSCGELSDKAMRANKTVTARCNFDTAFSGEDVTIINGCAYLHRNSIHLGVTAEKACAQEQPGMVNELRRQRVYAEEFLAVLTESRKVATGELAYADFYAANLPKVWPLGSAVTHPTVDSDMRAVVPSESVHQ